MSAFSVETGRQTTPPLVDGVVHIATWYGGRRRPTRQCVVNHAIDEWRRRLSTCVDAEGGHFEHYL